MRDEARRVQQRNQSEGRDNAYPHVVSAAAAARAESQRRERELQGLRRRRVLQRGDSEGEEDLVTAEAAENRCRDDDNAAPGSSQRETEDASSVLGASTSSGADHAAGHRGRPCFSSISADLPSAAASADHSMRRQVSRWGPIPASIGVAPMADSDGVCPGSTGHDEHAWRGSPMGLSPGLGGGGRGGGGGGRGGGDGEGSKIM